MIHWIGTANSESDARIVSALCGEFEVRLYATFPKNEGQFNCRAPLAVILNLPGQPEADAALLDAAERAYRGVPIVVRAASCDPENSRPALAAPVRWIDGQAGAETVIETLRAAIGEDHVAPLARMPSAAPRPAWRKMLIGESPAMERVAGKIALIANRRSTVLITGETGTGKEVVARALHAASGRSSFPLVTVNCGALPESLLEAELFGHAKGAFTGAVGQRIGRFEQAHRGTLLLDEIGDMPLSAQTTLLRVLQEKEFHRVGGVDTVRVDARVVAATNVDLQKAVERKTFRPDLLYRLHVFPIHVPPLRERLCDVEPLAGHFIEKFCAEEHLPPKRLSAGALSRLSDYDWPGNVRQLCHTIEMAIVTSGDRSTLLSDDFSLPGRGLEDAAESNIAEFPDEGVDFDELVNEVQRGILNMALERAGGNKSRAASLLRMKRSTLVSRVKALAG
jgi:transcriptional regulator with GAF, ATPase, and Fis domain